jgi:hypothetical protein
VPRADKPSEKPGPRFRPQAGRISQDPSAVIEKTLSAYSPDDEFAPRSVENPVRRFFEALKSDDAAKRPKIEEARIVEVNPFGAVRVRTVKSAEKFREALELGERGAKRMRVLAENGIRLRAESSFTAVEKRELREMSKSRKFRESFDLDLSDTTGNAANPFNEYLPIMGGPFSRQLYLFDFLDMSRKAFEAWNHNPLAHQGVKITTSFVLGRGVTAKANSPLVQERFDAWAKRIDLLGGRLESWSDMLSRDGELMVRRYFNPITKEMFLRWIDPSTIWEIVTDLEDIEKVFYYHQQFPTQYQVLYGTGSQRSQFDPSKFGTERYVINQIPASEMYHVKINCSPNEKRGRSDLFSILGWLKRYKDFQTGVVLRAIIQGTFSWKMKLKGTEADVAAFINQFGTQQPDFGSVHVENEAATLEPMAPQMKGAGLDDAPGIVNMIAVGLGIPKEYLGFSDNGSRAGAIVASEPGAKKFMSRQLLLGRFLKSLAKDWAENEIASGRLPAIDPETGEPLDTEIEFQFPEIAIEDRSSKIKDIELSEMSGYISKTRAATMVAKELGIEGYNFEAEMEDRAREEQAGINDLFRRTAPTPEPGETDDDEGGKSSTSGLGSDDKRKIKAQGRNL